MSDAPQNEESVKIAQVQINDSGREEEAAVAVSEAQERVLNPNNALSNQDPQSP